MKKYIYTVYFILTFLIIDIFLRVITSNTSYMLYGLMFDFSFIFILLGIILLLNKVFKKIIYYSFTLLFFVLFITNLLYHKFFDYMFSFSKIGLASEGGSYLFEVILSSPITVYICLILVVLLVILFSNSIPSIKSKNDNKMGIGLIILGIVLHIIMIVSLGTYYNDYRSLDSLKNSYYDQLDSNKAYSVSGLYCYSIRDFYLSYINNKNNSNVDIDSYLSSKEHNDNEYTDIFKDKNLIFVMMESIDSFLIDEDVMPTLYNISNNSINFKNNYSQRLGGGDTFNTEFTINTGLVPPYGDHISYGYKDNVYPYSLASMFINNGYTAESFHFNDSAFYKRGITHSKLGYKYNGLIDMGYSQSEYGKDSIFFSDLDLSNMIIRDNKFISFIVTYSAHMPYKKSNYLCSSILDGNPSEIDCINAQARETDNMIKAMLERLEENDLLESTVIVFYTDHFVYGFYDRNTLVDIKGTNDNNLLSNTPFIIYNNGIKEDVTYLSSSIDVVPTLINMFGLSDDYSNYMGNDVFSIADENVVYFKNNSFIYKNNYYRDGKLVYGIMDEEEILNKKKDMYEFYNINEGIFINNYFKG